MPFTFGWLYRKLGRRYFPLYLVFEYVSGLSLIHISEPTRPY